MTEDEAKTRWCPFARARADGEMNDDGTAEEPFAANRKRDGVPDHWCLCLASGCMAWRWFPDRDGEGYCGLAGSHRDEL